MKKLAIIILLALSLSGFSQNTQAFDAVLIRDSIQVPTGVGLLHAVNLQQLIDSMAVGTMTYPTGNQFGLSVGGAAWVADSYLSIFQDSTLLYGDGNFTRGLEINGGRDAFISLQQSGVEKARFSFNERTIGGDYIELFSTTLFNIDAGSINFGSTATGDAFFNVSGTSHFNDDAEFDEDILLSPQKKLILNHTSGENTYIWEGANGVIRLVSNGTQSAEFKGTETNLPADLNVIGKIVSLDSLRIERRAIFKDTVGIFTNNPVEKLDVFGKAIFGEGITLQRNNMSYGINLVEEGGDATFLRLWQQGIGSAFYGFQSGDPTLYIINSYLTGDVDEPFYISLSRYGNMGIDTVSSDAKLHLLEDAVGVNGIKITNRNRLRTWAITVDALAVDDGKIGLIDITGGTISLIVDTLENVGIGSTVFGTSANRNLSIGNGIAGATTANQASFYVLAGEMWVKDGGGTATQISPHASDAPEWMYDEDDPIPPQIDKEINDFDGMVRYTNNTRKNNLIEMHLNGETLPDGNLRIFIFTETYHEHNLRTGNNLSMDNWDDYQDREYQKSLTNINRYNEEKDKQEADGKTYEMKKPELYTKKSRK